MTVVSTVASVAAGALALARTGLRRAGTAAIPQPATSSTDSMNNSILSAPSETRHPQTFSAGMTKTFVLVVLFVNYRTLSVLTGSPRRVV